MQHKYLYLLLILIFLGCSKEEVVESETSRFPVLEYNSELSENLTLNIDNIILDDPKEFLYWSQHYQNPQNNLNHIFTNSKFIQKTKIISGSRGVINITQPVFFEDTLCQFIGDGTLKCVNINSKEVIFNFDVKKKDIKKYELIRGGISYFDNKIVFVDAYGQVKLFDVNDKSEIWSTEVGFPILSPPLVYRGHIYFISSDNRIFSINIENGSVAWSFQTISETKKNLFTASPVAYENTIIVPFSNGELVAFDHDNGRPIWSENLSKTSLVSNFDIKDISASPVIQDGIIYSLSSNGKFMSINVIDGGRNWSIDLSGYRTPIISGNQIYIIDKNGKLICLDKLNGDVYWITELNKYKKGQDVSNLNLWNGPYLINSLLYNFSYFGEMKVVSPINGEILSSDSLGINKILVPPIVLKDTIYFTNGDSNVYKFN